MKSHASILLVDDDPFVLETGARLLEVLGYGNVHTAAGPEEARHFFGQCPGAVDLLISDLQMPDTNGDELAVEFRMIDPGLKVIFLSGANPETYRSKVPLKAHDNFLAKPYRAADLARAIERSLRHEEAFA